jgi:hypothetical protein
MMRTYEWIKSWNMLERTEDPMTLINILVQNQAHPSVAH